MRFICPKCAAMRISKTRIFKCPDCGFEPKIEDYEEAFAQLKEKLEEERNDAGFAIQTYSASHHSLHRCISILAISNAITFMLLILAWLKLRL